MSSAESLASGDSWGTFSASSRGLALCREQPLSVWNLFHKKVVLLAASPNLCSALVDITAGYTDVASDKLCCDIQLLKVGTCVIPAFFIALSPSSLSLPFESSILTKVVYSSYNRWRLLPYNFETRREICLNRKAHLRGRREDLRKGRKNQHKFVIVSYRKSTGCPSPIRVRTGFVLVNVVVCNNIHKILDTMRLCVRGARAVSRRPSLSRSQASKLTSARCCICFHRRTSSFCCCDKGPNSDSWWLARRPCPSSSEQWTIASLRWGRFSIIPAWHSRTVNSSFLSDRPAFSQQRG